MGGSNLYRIERDSLGEFKVPRDAWYGIQTAGVANFPSAAAVRTATS